MNTTAIRRFHESDTDWLVNTHQSLYAKHDGFDDSFGPLVRSIVDDFNTAHNPTCERGWIAQHGSERIGSIFCVRHDSDTAKLRLFLVVPDARGTGLGQKLLQTCTEFAKTTGYQGMTLWTHESHRAACVLYARNGWQLRHSSAVTSFGQSLIEQTWTLHF